MKSFINYLTINFLFPKSQAVHETTWCVMFCKFCREHKISLEQVSVKPFGKTLFLNLVLPKYNLTVIFH